MPESLEFGPYFGSVVHSMPPATDQRGIPDVAFVGGYVCSYSIYDRVLECKDLADSSNDFRAATEQAYSGHWAKDWKSQPGAPVGGSCINNPCAQCWVSGGEGPLPEGEYVIAQGYLDPDRPFMSYKLEKIRTLCEGTYVPDDLRELNAVVPKIVGLNNAFMIHFGDVKSGTTLGEWSEGCVVVADNANAMRDRINTLGGGTLTVKFSATPAMRSKCDAQYGYKWAGTKSTPIASTSPDPCFGLWPASMLPRPGDPMPE